MRAKIARAGRRFSGLPRVNCSGTPVRLLTEQEVHEFFAAVTAVIDRRRRLVVIGHFAGDGLPPKAGRAGADGRL